MKKTLKNIAVLFSAAALTACFSGCDGKGEKEDDITEIDLNDYVECEFDGYDGSGTGEIVISFDKIVEDNRRDFDLRSKSTDEDVEEVIEELQKYISGELSGNGELSNGTDATFVWDKDMDLEELEDDYDIKFKFSDKSFSVEGLEEIEVIDAFEGIDLKLSGKSPNGKAELTKKSSKINGINFSYEIDKNSELSNGDTVTISITNDIDELHSVGYGVEETTKEVTIEDLEYYPEKFADIPADDLEIMKKHNLDSFNATIANSWEERIKCNNIELESCYYLTSKEGMNNNIGSKLYFIYRFDIEIEGETFSIYRYAGYEDVYFTSGNEFVYDINKVKFPEGSAIMGITSGEVCQHGDEYFAGYASLEEIHNKYVTGNLANYVCEEIDMKNAE